VPRSEELLRDVGRILTRSHALHETLENIVRLVARWMHAAACSVYLLEEGDQWLVLRATRGLKREAVGQVRLRVGQGIAGACLAARETVAVPDVSLDKRNLAFPESGELRFRSMLAVPLIVRDVAVGVLTFQTTRPRVFKPQEIELLELIAAQVGSIVLNARLLHQVSRGGLGGARAEVPPPLPAPFPPGTVLRGLATSPGIAIGHVHIQAAPLDLDNLSYRPARTRAAEWRSVQRALRETIRQLTDQRAAVGEGFGEEFADVFTTHIMILEDEGFRTKLRARVDEHGDGARALVEVMREYTEVFANLRDAALRERAADIEDVVRRTIGELVGMRQHNPPLRDGVIVLADRIAPGAFLLLETEKIAGLVTSRGGPTSHAAIFARSLEIPAVTGIRDLLARARPTQEVIVDGVEGLVIIDPTRAQRRKYEVHTARYRSIRDRMEELRDLPSVTLDGVEIRLSANIGGLYDLDHLKDHGSRGVGLFRTEVLVLSARAIPDEEEQFHIYRRIAERLAPEPVTVRCFDLGGDKVAPELGVREANPQLGWRSIRVLLDRRDLFRAQLRALVRANRTGNLRVLVPMITTLEELEATRELLRGVCAELEAPAPPLGVMLETPAAVALVEHLAQVVEFFAVGTNDLVQYTLGADRENERVAALYDPFHPAVLQQLWRASQAAQVAGIPCSVCGELAANPLAAPLLVGLGIRELSMAPLSTASIRQVVRAIRCDGAEQLAKEVLGLARAGDVRARLRAGYAAMGLLEDPDLELVLRSGLPGRIVDSAEGRG
jgi:phosphotransferase system enzyme I (PtsP)